MFSSYLTENTLHVHYKDQSVIAVYGNSRFYIETYMHYMSTL